MRRAWKTTTPARAWWSALATLIALIALAGCGGGTDVDNALVQGQVRDGGTLVASAQVTVMPEDYNPVMGDPSGRTRAMLTDQDGKFAFPDLPAGHYSLETVDQAHHRMDWMAQVEVTSGTTVNLIANLDAARTVIVQLPDSVSMDAYLFIPGTAEHALRDSAGPGARFTLTHVPADSVAWVGLGSMANPAAPSLLHLSLPPGRNDTLVILAF